MQDPLPASDQPAIRVVMMPSHANPQGSIFGGVILSMIDQAAYVEALRHADAITFEGFRPPTGAAGA